MKGWVILDVVGVKRYLGRTRYLCLWYRPPVQSQVENDNGTKGRTLKDGRTVVREDDGKDGVILRKFVKVSGEKER